MMKPHPDITSVNDSPSRKAICRQMLVLLRYDFTGYEHWRAWSVLMFRYALMWVISVALLWGIYLGALVAIPVVLAPEALAAELVSDGEMTTVLLLRLQTMLLHDLPVYAFLTAAVFVVLDTLRAYAERAERLLVMRAKRQKEAQGGGYE